MKVGILTYHHVENYGALLQAYALSETIKSQGHEVEFIDYRPYRAIIYYLKEAYLSPHFAAYAAKSRQMKRFVHSRLKLSHKVYYTRAGLQELRQRYSLVVCGSDEVWNVKSIRKFDPTYFLDFLDGDVRKVSYAASFGRASTLGNHRETAQKLVEQFDAISVRDRNSLQVLDRECGKQATKVLDPTFLGDFSKIMAVPQLEKYALVYGRLTKPQKDYVKAVAIQEGLTVVSIGYPCETADKNFLSIGPEEWLGYFARANYIFTDFYHGVIFSIIFQKPFVFFGRKDKVNKTNDLLKDLDLENRILSQQTALAASPKPLPEIDYQAVYQRLEKSIQISQHYLAEALNGQN